MLSIKYETAQVKDYNSTLDQPAFSLPFPNNLSPHPPLSRLGPPSLARPTASRPPPSPQTYLHLFHLPAPDSVVLTINCYVQLLYLHRDS